MSSVFDSKTVQNLDLDLRGYLIDHDCDSCNRWENAFCEDTIYRLLMENVRVLRSQETEEITHVSFADIIAVLFPELRERSVQRLCLYWRKRHPQEYQAYLSLVCFGGKGSKANQLAFRPEDRQAVAELVQRSRAGAEETLAAQFVKTVDEVLLQRPLESVQQKKVKRKRGGKMPVIPSLPVIHRAPLSPLKMSDDFRNRLNARQSEAIQRIVALYDSSGSSSETECEVG